MKAGKLWGMRRLANADGFFSMAAIDQRPPISKFIANKQGIDESKVSDQSISELKGMLAEGLAPAASALCTRCCPAFSNYGKQVQRQEHPFRSSSRASRST